MIYKNDFNHISDKYKNIYSRHIHQINNFLETKQCEAIIEYVLSACQIADDYPMHAQKYVESHRSHIVGQLSHEVCDMASALFGRKLILAESPIVRSLPSKVTPKDNEGYIHKHADSEVLSGDIVDVGASMVTYENDVTPGLYEISAILYLNENFDGGSVLFEDYGIEVKPEVGKLLLFPSGHEYMHQVLEVSSGKRFFCTFFLTTPKVAMLFSNSSKIRK